MRKSFRTFFATSLLSIFLSFVLSPSVFASVADQSSGLYDFTYEFNSSGTIASTNFQATTGGAFSTSLPLTLPPGTLTM